MGENLRSDNNHIAATMEGISLSIEGDAVLGFLLGIIVCLLVALLLFAAARGG